MSPHSAAVPNDLEAFWMPFTSNRQFKKAPRMLVAAEGMHYTSADGRKILDGTAGLWCCNAGHGRPRIVQAIRDQVGVLDFAPSFQMGHPLAFELANRIVEIAPEGMGHVFFTNSGSESVDTALKIALAYHRARGEGARTRLIGRERGYHGVNFGGISVGGMVNNRKAFGTLLNGVDHLPHTHLPAQNAFSRGQPEHGAHLADELERLVALHGAETIAAVIVEPVAGATGVLPPPKGYLQRLREITRKHGILLIFDEVISGYGRLGTPFAAQFFDVAPDLIATAKGLTSGVIPMGAVIVADAVHDAFMQGPEEVIELFHGYTYSGTPIACAAAIATLETYREEDLFARTAAIAPQWQEALHSLRDLPGVIDIRNIGLVAAVEFAPFASGVGKRGFETFVRCFDRGLMIRSMGDSIALSPPLIIEAGQIDEIVDTLRGVITDINRAA
jgi:beta-alanine--pyruvate transaminase